MKVGLLPIAALAIVLASCGEAEPQISQSSAQAFSAPVSDAGPSCGDADRRCVVTFVYADRGEKSVELRGDFRAGGWGAGVPMTKRGKTWAADVEIPYGRDVAYKLLLDGARWTRDPARFTPASGTDNSRLDAVTCNPHRCAQP